jgi:hypothetical protein
MAGRANQPNHPIDEEVEDLLLMSKDKGNARNPSFSTL